MQQKEKGGKQLKHLKTCAVAGSALLVASLILLALPVSPSTHFVLASPGNGGDYGESCIAEVILEYMVDTSTEHEKFYHTGETIYLPEGAILTRIGAAVLIDNAYAATEADAIANTRVHVLLKDPSDETVYDNVLPVVGASGKEDNCWWVGYGTDPLQETLVPGKYTLTTTYEIYVEPE